MSSDDQELLAELQRIAEPLAQRLGNATDDDLLDYIRSAGQTSWHPIGTCKMGTDPAAVVDHELKVHGIVGLRVADSSVFPFMTSSNPNAPSIMMGERCADLLTGKPAT